MGDSPEDSETSETILRNNLETDKLGLVRSGEADAASTERADEVYRVSDGKDLKRRGRGFVSPEKRE